MEKDNLYMKRAIELSKEGVKNGGGPFGAVIVKDGKIVAEAFNTVTKTNDPTAHAEVNAIRNAAKDLKTFDLKGATIYSSCEPCPMCLSAIYWAKIDKLFFANTRKDASDIGFDDSLIYNEIPKEPTNRKIITKQIMHKEALSAFKLWEENEDKIEY